MGATRGPIRVAVAVDPFLARSALHATLEQDDRFDARLCPIDEDAVAHAAAVEAHILIVSKSAQGAAMCVVLVSDSTGTVQLSYAGARQDVGYVSSSELRDQLASTLLRGH